jgi:DNA-binding FadR family transcriptional regulator
VIREAAACLVSRGVVDVRPRRGMTVRAPDGKGLAESLIAQLQMSKVSLPQLLQVRAVLETAIVELAAEQRTEEDIARLHDNLERMQAAHLEAPQALSVDLEFHDLLAAATHNPFFTLVSRPITELLYSLYVNQSGYMSFQALTLAEHQAVVESVVDKDPEAAVLAMQRHLDRVGTTVAELLLENRQEVS